MHYEINVSKNGRHFFATHERSVTSKEALEKITKVFQEKFPQEEGYKISATKYETIGTCIEL